MPADDSRNSWTNRSLGLATGVAVAVEAVGAAWYAASAMPSKMLAKTCFLVTGSLALCALLVIACGDDDETSRRDTGTRGRVHGLTPEQAEEVLVKIGNESITVGEFAERLADQSPYLRARYNSPERRREFLDNLIRFELLAAEAHRRNYDKLPDVERTRKQVMIQQMMKAEFEDRVRLEDITDQEIRTYYEAHPEEFNKPEQVRASIIVMRDRAAAQRVLSQILAAPNDVALFRRLAEQHNEDPETRSRLGDLRFFSRPAERQQGEPEVAGAIAEAAFAIPQIGGVHRELVRVQMGELAGFAIVKLTGKRAALHRTVDEARRPIQNRLWREKRERAIEEFLTRLRREANVQENFELLREVQIDFPEGMPLDVPPPQPGDNQQPPLLPGIPGMDDAHGHGDDHGADPRDRDPTQPDPDAPVKQIRRPLPTAPPGAP